MHDTLRALRSLQKIDRLIFQVESELRRLPRELARRQEEIEERKARVAEVRRRVHDLRTEAKEIEDYTTGLRQRQRKLEHESTSQKVDAAMLASFEHEIRTIKRNISQAEDDAIRKLEAAGQLQGEAETLDAALAEELATFEELRANVAKELAAAEERNAELNREREAQSAEDIPPAHLELYRKLLEIREGEALAELAQGHCQVCCVQIPKNLGVRLARGTELVQCPSCDRILYVQV